MTGNGTINAIGGNGLAGGGGGSGGRVKLFYFSWFDSSRYPDITAGIKIIFNISGGLGFDNNLKG